MHTSAAFVKAYQDQMKSLTNAIACKTSLVCFCLLFSFDFCISIVFCTYVSFSLICFSIKTVTSDIWGLGGGGGPGG